MSLSEKMKIFTRYDSSLFIAAVSGLLLAAAFPPVGAGWLGFIGLVPLFLICHRRPFASGLTCGLFFFAPLLYWLNIVMTSYGGLALFFSVVAWLLLCLYLSIFFAAATWLLVFFKDRLSLHPIFSAPFLWVGLEYLRGHFLTGFPWGLLGYAAIDLSALRQAADIFGVYGLSFLFILCNATIAGLIRRQFGSQVISGAILCVLLLGGCLWYGNSFSDKIFINSARLNVGLVQGNISQQHKWDRAYRQQTLDRYTDLSLSAAADGAELLVWPEAATPFYIQDESVDSRQVVAVSQKTRRYLLFGGPSYESRPDGGYRYHNSAFLLSPEGSFLGRSDKIHLVPFGEYVPFGKLFFFINKLVSGVGDFSPGMVKPLAINGYDLGVLICYEAIFPELARDYVQKGSDLLINLTNDAWFGRSSAPRQLLDMTRMRAIENRIWIARAANTGISALISPAGDILQETSLFVEGTIVGPVGLGAGESLYQRSGDLLPWVSLCSVLGCLLLVLRQQPADTR